MNLFQVLSLGTYTYNKGMILNIKIFNKFINYIQFTMKSFANVINLKPNVFMASID